MKKQVIRVQFMEDSAIAPIAMMVQIASRFDSVIHINCDDKHINAKSIMGMMCLSLTNGEEVEIECDGSDENEAIETCGAFLRGEITK